MKHVVSLLLISITIYNLFAQEIDSIIDIRDEQIYKIVKIGQQWWMQENLNIGVPNDITQDASDNGVIEKSCYNNSDSLCDIYGGLYQWNEMMDYNPSDTGNPGIIQGVCPVGWHLPTDSEWNELINFLGGESEATGKLKETGILHWLGPNSDATNESGFTALPGGYDYKGDSSYYFEQLGEFARFWSSTDNGENWGIDQGWVRILEANYFETPEMSHSQDFSDGLSIRCLNDTSHFGYLTISDKNLKTISSLRFMNVQRKETVVIINLNAARSINISSIYNNNSAFIVNNSPSVLTQGDSIHLTIVFNPPDKGIFLDTIFIHSNDPYKPILKIPIEGIYYTEAPCGIINQNITWTKAESPYYLNCNLLVSEGATLTIEPGVTVLIDSMNTFIIDGELEAHGLPDDSIIFSSFGDEIFNQLKFRSGSRGDLSHFIVENARIGISSEASKLVLSQSQVHQCDTGVLMVNDSLIIEHTLITHNQNGVTFDPPYENDLAYLLLSNCEFSFNTYGIYFLYPAKPVDLKINQNIFKHNKYALEIHFNYNTSKLNISKNRIESNLRGILLYRTKYNNGNDQVSDNIIVNNETGIETYSYYDNLLIRGNRILSNSTGIIIHEDQHETITITRNIISNNIQDGIHDSDNSEWTSEISYNSILNNGDDGIQTGSLPNIHHNNLYGNSGYNVRSTQNSGMKLNAENNYWGVTEYAGISSTIYDFFDDANLVQVDFEPFLGEAVPESYLDFALDDTVCEGGEVPPLIAVGDSIKWYSNADFTGLLHSGNTLTIGETDAGIYTYYVTQSLWDGTILNDSAVLIIGTYPVINSIEKTNETTCTSSDGTITIDASNEYPLRYSIDGINFYDNGGAFTGIDNGNYPVVVANSMGCKTAGDIVEIISEGVIPPAPTAGKDTIYCAGDNIKDLYATASSGGVLTWYSDAQLNNIIGIGTLYTPGNLYETTSFFVTETVGDCESPSTTVTIKVRNDPPFEDEELCLITIDLNTGKNLLVWEKTPDKGIFSYNLYKETSVIGQYELIGNMPFDQLSVFIDSESKPEESQSLYKIASVDSCGNESEKSAFHKSLFLQYVGSTGGVNLQWSDYEIEGGDISFVTYEIYRGEDPSSLEKISDVSASLDRFTDNYSEALTKKYYYRIAGVKVDPCYPTGNLKGISLDYNRSMSNLEDNQVISVQDYLFEDKLNIYPNPFNNSTILKFHNPERYPYKLYITNLAGGLCLFVNNITTSEYVLEKDNLKAGLYMIELRGPQIYRGKMVIE